MTNYKKMYELTSKAISDALAILSSDPQREDAKEWFNFCLSRLKYVLIMCIELPQTTSATWRYHMNKLGTKTLKILLFIGVFSYLQYYDVKRGAFSVNSITGGLFAASAVYLIASLFGIVLSLTQNYLIAIVGTAALALFLAFKLDDLIASVSWLTEERMMYILGGFATLCFIRDIIINKKNLVRRINHDNRRSTIYVRAEH